MDRRTDDQAIFPKCQQPRSLQVVESLRNLSIRATDERAYCNRQSHRLVGLSLILQSVIGVAGTGAALSIGFRLNNGF
jgi:hypothetical protein